MNIITITTLYRFFPPIQLVVYLPRYYIIIGNPVLAVQLKDFLHYGRFTSIIVFCLRCCCGCWVFWTNKRFGGTLCLFSALLLLNAELEPLGCRISNELKRCRSSKCPLCVNSCLLAGLRQYVREGLSINAQLYSIVHGLMHHRFRLMNEIGCGRQCNDASSHYITYFLLLFAVLISFCVCFSLGKQIAAVWPLICHPLGFRRLSPKWQGM